MDLSFDTNYEKMKLSKIISYIFVPPILTMILYIVLSLWLNRFIPTLLIFFLSASVVLFPIQIYLMVKENKRRFGKYSMDVAFLNQKKYPIWLIFLLGALTFGFAGLMTLMVTPIENSIFNNLSMSLYQWIPDFFNWSNTEYFNQYSKSVLIITGVLYFILNGFLGPIVEELFFRGYLTSKLKINNWLAPLIMTILFSIYHFWLPFDNLFRIIAFFPAFYLAWRLKNIWISIVFHCMSNIFTAIMFFITILSI